ncbi:HD domain-containing protein [Methanolobus bombayensis]|uniref:HD domain-containing protein n=1 Tax=Methanolobus bombayensis TaxID=38023 RepID=UPI001AEB39E9|nr:HD domain-containing protein [Methanolobus bombayensis]MBP1908008.1 HD superfamily phosphohydrolase [Methanolobus bombayensis]
MKVIRDPIHGYIELDPLTLSIIDSPQMQRLRRLSQLGLSNLVYPGANHSRFEHSLGVMHLATMLTGKIDSVTDDEKEELRVAALLHDVGHGPYSHVTENLTKLYTRQHHEDVRKILKNGELGEILSDNGLNPATIEDHIQGKTDLGKILNSEIDVDRMDYLVRDSHYTGVAFGLVDHVRLINEMKFYENKLVVNAGGVKAAESLLVSRFLMHPSVYYHHVSRIAETMFTRAVDDLIQKDSLSPFELRKMDDSRLLEIIRNDDGYAGELSQRLDNRKLYKRALYVGFEEVGEGVLRHRKNIKRVEAEIASEVGIDTGSVLIDIPKNPEIAEMKALVKINNKMLRLDEASHVVATLEQAHRENWKMGVYTPKEHREDVAKAARDFFDVKKSTKQFRLTEIEG